MWYYWHWVFNNKKSESPLLSKQQKIYISLIDLVRHNWQKRRNPILLDQSLDFLYDAAYVHVRMDRSMGTTPVTSSFIPPSATHELFARTGIPGVHGAAHMKQELLPKNESDVKPRPDWFTSEGHFAPDSRSTCRIYHRKSPAFRSREIPAYSSLLRSFSRPLQRSPRYSTTSRAPELQHLWGWAWRRLEGHAWRTAKKLCLAETSTRERFLPSREEYYFIGQVGGWHK